MKIGIVSKESHAKSHLKALRQEGHDVTVLGGGISKIPDSYEAIVCRPASVSKTAFETARAAKKSGRTVIIANGVSEVLAGIRRAQGHKVPSVLSSGVDREKTARDLATELAMNLGAYSHYMHRDEAGPIVAWLETISGKGVDTWRDARKSHTSDALRRIMYGDPPAGLTKMLGWHVPPRGALAPVTFWLGNKSLWDTLLDRMGLYPTRQAAQAALDERKAANRLRQRQTERDRAKEARDAARKKKSELLQKKRAAEAAEEAIKAKAASLRAAREAEATAKLEAEAAQQREIDRAAVRQAAEEARQADAEREAREAPVAAPEPPVVAPVVASPEESWEQNVKAALEILLPEMKTVGLKSLTVTDEGVVSFERAVVVVQQGSFKLS